MTDVAISLGANVGDPKAQVAEAMHRIADHSAITALQGSRFYLTDPVGPVVDQPLYINAAMTLQTELSPGELLAFLKETERHMGRAADGVRWGPRVIDCDIVLFGQRSVDTADLVIPHRELEHRAFVLLPLSEIAGTWTLPDGRTIDSLAASCDARGVRVLEKNEVSHG